MLLSFEINEIEHRQMQMSLSQHLDKLEEIELNMITQQFEKSEKILLAYYGKKYNSFTGWKTIPAFHLTIENKILSKELSESFSRRKLFTEQKKIVFRLFQNLCALRGENNWKQMNDIEIEIKENNEKLNAILKNHDITVEVAEMKKLLNKLSWDANYA